MKEIKETQLHLKEQYAEYCKHTPLPNKNGSIDNQQAAIDGHYVAFLFDVSFKELIMKQIIKNIC